MSIAASIKWYNKKKNEKVKILKVGSFRQKLTKHIWLENDVTANKKIHNHVKALSLISRFDLYTKTPKKHLLQAK